MEESCFSGYCRQIDAARTVFCEYELRDGIRFLAETDCLWPACEHAAECPIAKAFSDGAEPA